PLPRDRHRPAMSGRQLTHLQTGHHRARYAPQRGDAPNGSLALPLIQFEQTELDGQLLIQLLNLTLQLLAFHWIPPSASSTVGWLPGIAGSSRTPCTWPPGFPGLPPAGE